ncbi:6433_t:CDS:2 [Gigaspora margarita]|uniref:6433_t:CDS:1 n=1 Tax=Gigaspora margarita TaxID=4874 RepID=A0ABN7UXD5_GIGMA|nr:6433_t:CDS:2 [Gigaspora margarita]
MPIPSLLLFPGLVLGFSVLFTSTIYKSESTCSDKGRPTNEVFYKNTDDSRPLEASNRLNQELKSSEQLKSNQFNSTSKLNINHIIINKTKVSNYEAADKIENYEEKKYTIDNKNFIINKFLKYLSEQFKLLHKNNSFVKAFFSRDFEITSKLILEFQKDIKDLEIFYLRNKFGEYYDGIHCTSRFI